MVLLSKLKNIISFIKFVSDVNKLKDTDNFIVILSILKYYIKNKKFRSSSVVCGRSINESSRLLEALINTYIEQKSSVVLAQIFEVLKTEFIERSK